MTNDQIGNCFIGGLIILGAVCVCIYFVGKDMGAPLWRPRKRGEP